MRKYVVGLETSISTISYFVLATLSINNRIGANTQLTISYVGHPYLSTNVLVHQYTASSTVVRSAKANSTAVPGTRLKATIWLHLLFFSGAVDNGC